jgi:hypothetical protein
MARTARGVQARQPAVARSAPPRRSLNHRRRGRPSVGPGDTPPPWRGNPGPYLPPVRRRMALLCAAISNIRTSKRRNYTMAPLPSHSDNRRLVNVARVLPVKPRAGRPPGWPSGRVPSEREAGVWRRLWKLPQAHAWIALPGASESVERYALLSIAVGDALAAGTAQAALLQQVRSLELDLGISPAGLARLHWVIADAAPDRAKPAPAPHRPRRMRAPVSGSDLG